MALVGTVIHVNVEETKRIIELLRPKNDYDRSIIRGLKFKIALADMKRREREHGIGKKSRY